MDTSKARKPFGFTVGITTHNRPSLLQRAIESALGQNWSPVEIIVVDDASSYDVERIIKSFDGNIRFLRNAVRKGPNAGRNQIIRKASSPWVLLLDDDDTLIGGALSMAAHAITEFVDSQRYPVLQFATTRGRTGHSFTVARLKNYMDGTIVGDFTPVVQRDLFLELGLAYPPVRIGGESLLWWRVADAFGIPTWETQLVRVGSEAGLRLTSVDHQLLHADEYAHFQEMILEQYGDILKSQYPLAHDIRVLGAATYWLLAGNRHLARRRLSDVIAYRSRLAATGLWIISFAPEWLVRRLFRLYRRMTAL